VQLAERCPVLQETQARSTVATHEKSIRLQVTTCKPFRLIPNRYLPGT
jgi:hypothetical protein